MPNLQLKGQTDCLQAPDQLGLPLQSDTLRVIDPDTYQETIRVTDIYMRTSQPVLTKRDTSYHVDPSTLVESMEVTHTYNTREISPDTIITKGNTHFYYIRKDDCLKISHIIRRF